uniref:Uncharacterized protein n=1 Tax=Vitis vinifera TaxID=29760 RepID=A5BCP7_VITVI|nr:hypothetical protein VITISV_040688 [Vitis vinifera]
MDFDKSEVFCMGNYVRKDFDFELVEKERYLSIDSTCVTAYGFMNANFNEESSSMRHEAGSFYIFIPQIELDEDEGISILSATLAWSDSPLSTFEESIHSYELSLYQCFTSQYLCFEYFRDISLSGLNVILSSTACEEKYLEVDF